MPRSVFALAIAFVAFAGGCQTARKTSGPFLVPNGLGPMTIAVAPAINLSGGRDFDVDSFADLMAGELNYADGVEVIPVNRVLAVLAAQEEGSIRSPEHALEVRRLLGVDAILVFAVTEYDPYDPPSIGISAQLFGSTSGPGVGRLDPIALSRQGRPFASASQASSSQLLAQYQGLIDSAQESVIEDVREFATRHEDTERSPFGWRLYLVSQQRYARYCCHTVIRSLLEGNRESGDKDPSRRPKVGMP